MADRSKIDIISDVMCPWCLIGYKRLEKAIVEMGIQDRIELEWHPFELNPSMPPEGEGLQEHTVRKYGVTVADSLSYQAEMTRLGAEVGFTFDFFDGMKIVNTREAHVVLEYAKGVGKQTALKARLFEAFFGEQKDVSARDILAQELKRVGINVDEALARMDDPAAQDRIQAREAYLQNVGVSMVPTMIFSQEKTLTGAQPIHVYKEALADLVGQSAVEVS